MLLISHMFVDLRTGIISDTKMGDSDKYNRIVEKIILKLDERSTLAALSLNSNFSPPSHLFWHSFSSLNYEVAPLESV